MLCWRIKYDDDDFPSGNHHLNTNWWWSGVVRVVNVPEIFIVPEISRNVSKSLEVIRPIILFKFVDFPESRAKNKLLFLNIMIMKLKHKDLESCLSKTCLLFIFIWL